MDSPRSKEEVEKEFNDPPKKLKFPLYDSVRPVPDFAESCIVCGKIAKEDGTDFILTCGALTGAERDDSELEGFLGLSYHHVIRSPDGKADRDKFAHFYIVSGANNGQFDLGFCSTKCLREFFAQRVDQLARAVDEQ